MRLSVLAQLQLSGSVGGVAQKPGCQVRIKGDNRNIIDNDNLIAVPYGLFSWSSYNLISAPVLVSLF